MNKFYSIVLLLLAGLSATGQSITGAAVDPEGWKLFVYVSGLNTNGTYSFGFATNNQALGNEKIKINLQSPGFDSTGASQTVNRIVFGTYQVRKTHPDQAFNAETNRASDMQLTVSLSDYVFSGDTNLVATFQSGFYTQGGSNTPAASGITVTNLSQQTYPKPIANWTWPGWNRETGSTMRLRAVGFAGQRPRPFDQILGKPLAAMRFIASDQYGNSVTQTVSSMSIDRTLPDIFPTGEYIADISTSTFTNGSAIRCDFIAYPFLGTSSSTFDTTANTYTGVTGLPTSLTNLCDRLNTYSASVAAVDPTFGSDTNGRVTNVTESLILTNHYFATLAKAASMIRSNNASAYGHDDVGGGIVYMSSNVVSWLGASIAVGYGTNPLAYITFRPLTGHSVTITNQTGNQDISDRIKIEDITIGGSSTYLNGVNYLWFNRVTFNTSGILSLLSPVTWATHCPIQRVSNLRPNGNEHNRLHLRGCDLQGLSNVTVSVNTLVGNYHPKRESTANFTIAHDVSAATGTSPEYTIWYNNWLAGLQTTATAVGVGQNLSITNGVAIVQNAFIITTNASTCVFNWGTASFHHTNWLMFHNSWIGKRVAGFGYQDTGTTTQWRHYWSFIGNLIENGGWKTDTHDVGNSNRFGNWPLMWSVGTRGMYHPSVNASGSEAPGSFVPYFVGMESYHPGNNTSATNTVESIAFRIRASVGGTNGVHGNGDWRFFNESYGFDVRQQSLYDYVVPWDLEGVARGAADIAGPYVSGNRKRASMQFGQ